MKYKSELIKEIVETRGHELSSLHYESECVEKWIEETKGAYPKLCDYEGEWLAYCLENEGIGEFPYLTIDNITSTTIENAVPLPFKSAVLKGNSEVVTGKNKCNMNEIQTGWIDGLSGEVTSNTGVYIPVKVSGTITISNYIHDKSRYVYEYAANGNYLGQTQVTSDTVTLDLKQNTTLLRIGFYDGKLSTVKSLELQVEQGKTATEYEPYHATLESVKMPVLTTTGKNLMPINSIVPQKWSGNILNHKICDINLKPNTSYTFSNGFSGASSAIRTRIYDGNNALVVDVWGNEYKTFKTNTNENYWVVAYKTGDANIIKDIQIEEGAVKTAYEPYQSNILTVNEEVTLRSNGDICDELNLLTGQLTQRIGEDGVVLSQEVIKTVELLVQNQEGNTLSVIKPIEGTMHLSTSSDTIKPLFSGEIPVEAITQNLHSFIGEE